MCTHFDDVVASEGRYDELQRFSTEQYGCPTLKTYCLPEREENDELDAQDFEKRFVLCNFVFELNIELYQSIHCNGNRYTFKAKNPHMCECWIEGGFTIPIEIFRNDRDQSEQDSNETILEDADVDDLKRRRALVAAQ